MAVLVLHFPWHIFIWQIIWVRNCSREYWGWDGVSTSACLDSLGKAESISESCTCKYLVIWNSFLKLVIQYNLHKKVRAQLPWCSRHQLICSASIVSSNCCFCYAYYCCHNYMHFELWILCSVLLLGNWTWAWFTWHRKTWCLFVDLVDPVVPFILWIHQLLTLQRFHGMPMEELNELLHLIIQCGLLIVVLGELADWSSN